MNGQLSFYDLIREERQPAPCIWLEEWNGHPFCYLWQTYRVRESVCVNDGNGCNAREWRRE